MVPGANSWTGNRDLERGEESERSDGHLSTSMSWRAGPGRAKMRSMAGPFTCASPPDRLQRRTRTGSGRATNAGPTC